MKVFSETVCALGEGPLWHPERKQFFWFDITGKRLLTRTEGGERTWQFDEHVSAAAWATREVLLIASETALFTLDLETGAQERVAALEADNPANRSNDGRADPWGGFWIGTMGLNGESEAGAIYRYFQGEVTRLIGGLTVPNAICFSPCRRWAYWADTRTSRIMRQELEVTNGWPEGEAEVFVDLTAEGLKPDGAVVDAEGCLWNAQWGSGRVARYGADGAFLSKVDVPATQSSCPAFGGEDLSTLYVTSAAGGAPESDTGAGRTYAQQKMEGVRGQAEHRVILPGLM